MLLKDRPPASQERERETKDLPYARRWRAAQEARTVRAYLPAAEKW
jgi:hypothetical protein